MKTSAQILGEAIAKDRVHAGKSQEDIAKEVGVTQQAFSGWEAGTSMPRKTRLARLALTFGNDSHTVRAFKEIFPHDWERQTTPIFSRADYANAMLSDTVLQDEHPDYSDDGRDDRHHIDPPKHNSNSRTWRSIEELRPHYEVKEGETLILPAGAAPRTPPPDRDERDRLAFREIHEALAKAADDVRFARQALDRTAEQIQRAISKLSRY